MILYYIVRVLAIMLYFSLLRREVRGKENIPRRGAVIVVANHLSVADPPLLGLCLGRRAAYVAKEELFSSPVFAFIIKRLGAFPVRRGRLNRDALKKAHEVLAGGQVLIMFPEGMRSKHSSLQTAYAGSALVAIRSQAPLLPVGISGTEVIKGLGWLWHRPRVLVNIGAPFYPPKIDGKMEKEKLSELTDMIMRHIAWCLPLEYRGAYSEEEGHDSVRD